MRATINISFPDELYIHICERSRSGAYASTSEYLRSLVRADLERNGRNEKPTSKGLPAPQKMNEAMVRGARESQNW